MYELIVFDLDGTLLDTLDDLTSAVNAALDAYALPRRTREEVRSFIGDGVVKLMERAVGRTDFMHFDGVMRVFREYYGVHCKDETRAYDGVQELLATLKARGKKLAVLSNKADLAARRLVEDYFPATFEETVGENEAAGIRRKPSPTALFAIMSRLCTEKEKTLYVGDSEVDIQTARNAGVDCISVTWGFKDESFLRENGATVLAHTPEEISSRIL